MRLNLVRAAALLGLMFAGCSNTVDLHDVVIFDVTVVDVESGEVRRRQSIAIDDKTITYLGTDTDHDHQGRIFIDASGLYAIPGLWDMHVHIEGKNLVEDNLILFPVYVAYGITTVRDMASDLGEQVLAWRDDIDADKLLGPRIYTAGRKIEGIDSIWKDDLEVATEAEMRNMMDLLDDYKVDFVKVTENALDAELFVATVREAHKRGYKVSGHVPHGATINEVAQSGMSSIEHASHILRLGSADEEDIAARVRSGTLSKKEAEEHYAETFNQEHARQAYEKFATYGVYVTPTLIGGHKMAYLDEDDHSDDFFQRYLTQAFMAPYGLRTERVMNATLDQRQARKSRFLRIAAQMPLLQELGVNLIAGSDSAPIAVFVYPGLGLHEELQILQNAGLSSLQVLQAATINGARFLQKDDSAGTLATGKVADIVLLRDNPLEDIAATLSIDTVVMRGRVFDRDELDLMLETAANSVVSLDAARLATASRTQK
jgi:imidazolonepropionase-like amidohydrolase